MEKTLYLEKRGGNFWKDDGIRNISDVGNYRVGAYDYSIKGKDGNAYTLEFGVYDKRKIRTTHKRTGQPLKNPICEVVMYNALYLRTYYENEKGCWGNGDLERTIYETPRLYTLENILAVVNEISVDTYTRIEFIN